MRHSKTVLKEVYSNKHPYYKKKNSSKWPNYIYEGTGEKTEKAMAPHSSTLLPGKSHGRKSLVGCSPWCHEESDTTEQLHFPFPLSCIGKGNGDPLQCSCLENPRDGGAWWAAIYGVTQSWTRLKRLSSSNQCKWGYWRWKDWASESECGLSLTLYKKT